MSATLDRAVTLAAEYRRLRDCGDVVLAAECRRTIEDLVGIPLEREVALPESVRRVMTGGVR